MKRLLKAFLKLFLSKEFIQNYRNYKIQQAIQQANKLLQKYGNEALSLLLKDSDIADFSIIYGTLLGAYREHAFIKHDDDLDVVCDIKYLSKEFVCSLQKKGFEISRIYIASDKIGVQMPMKYKGLTCDIYFAYRDEQNLNMEHIYTPCPLENRDWDYSVKHNIFRVHDMQIPSPESYTQIEFNGYKIKIPSNTDEILQKVYGKTYMTPIRVENKYNDVVCFPLEEKYFSCFPVDLFLNSGFAEKIKR